MDTVIHRLAKFQRNMTNFKKISLNWMIGQQNDR